jgi:hypothetical protein
MAQQIASGGISLVGIPHSEFRRTVYLTAGTTKADEGKPVTLDTTANNTFKLAGNTDVIYGCLKVVENRVQEGILVGTVEFKGGFTWTKSGVVAVGDGVVGAGAGAVKTGTNSRCFVVAVGTTTVDVAFI